MGRPHLETSRFQRLLFEQSTMGLALCRMDGSLVDVNPAFAAMLGRTVDETLALTYWDVTPKDYAQQEQAQLDSLQRTGRYGPYEKEYLRKDGTRVPVRLSGCSLQLGGETLIWSSAEDISELRQTVGALRRSEAFNRTVLNSSQDCVKVLGLDGTLTWLNEGGVKALELCGLDAVVGKWWPGFWEGQDREAAASAVLAAAEGTTSRFRGHYRVPSGSREWWDVLVSPLSGPDGRPERILAVSRDITLERRNEQLQTEILNRVSDAFVALDKDWHCTFLNEQAAALFGRRPDELIGKHIWTEFPGRMGPPFHRNYEKAMREQVPISFEECYVPWGRWFENRVFPSRDGLSIFFHEITERKRAEASLRVSQALYQDLVETSQDLIWQCDAEGRYTYLNPAWEEVFGYSREEMLGRRFSEFQMPEDAARDLQAFAHLLQEGIVKGHETVHIGKSGQPIHLLFNAKVLKDEAGIVAGTRGTAFDITERKQDEALSNGQKQLLEMIATDAPMEQTLSVLVRIMEAQAPGMLCSVLRLDPDGMHLRHGAAPSLPEGYIRAIDGSAIGPRAGSCGTAAFMGVPVFVEDIAEDPLWEDYRHLALPHGLRACWSTPIFDAKRRALGTFAFYYRQPGRPTSRHIQLMEIGTHIAALAIGHNLASAALRASEERLRLFIEHAPAALAMFDREMRYLAVSHRWLTDYGLGDRKVIGQSHYDVFKEIPERWRAMHRRGLSGEVVRAMDDSFERPDGSVQWLQWEIRPWHGASGGVGGIVLFTEDITARKRAEGSLAQRASQLAALNAMGIRLSSTLDLPGRARAGLEGLLAAALPDVALLFLREGEEFRLLDSVYGKESLQFDETPCLQIAHSLCELGAEEGHALYSPYIQADSRCDWDECKKAGMESFALLPLKSGEEIIGMLSLISATGRDFRQQSAFLETMAAQVATGIQNALLHAELQIHAADLEHRVEERSLQLRQANEELGRAVQRAQEADRAKSAFLSAMSHELRTPLNSVIGFTGVLLQGLVGDLKPQQREPLLIVQRNGRHLLDLINDVLDLSKIEAAEMRLSSLPFDLVQTLREALESMTPDAAAKGLSLVETFEVQTLPFIGDRRRVAQILLNLLSNAVKFTETGTVALSLSLDPGLARIAVRDTGPGIAPGDLPRLFREFEQLDVGLARRSEGTGLGLALSQRLARLMRGDIVVESRLGQGSTFTLTLPMSEGRLAP